MLLTSKKKVLVVVNQLYIELSFNKTLSNQTTTAIDYKQLPLTKFIALLQYNAIMLMFYD